MGVNSINNNIVIPVNSCEGTQDKKENKNSSLNFSQMLFDNIQREKALQLQQKKEEDEENKDRETKQPDPNNTIHQQYMLMSYVISSSSKKKENEEKK